MFGWLAKLLGVDGKKLDELARRLDMPKDELVGVEPRYRAFSIPKHSGGGTRRINAPDADLKRLQRRILRRLLARLRVHPAAVGFEPGESFVTNAVRHVRPAVVIHFDVKDFFPSIRSERIYKYFRYAGWNRQAAHVLTRLVTHEGALPQGAPTSPRLSNLVNFRMDARLAGLAARHGAVYTRYADDVTVSLHDEEHDVRPLVGGVATILREEGYQPHTGKKFDVRRRHHRQEVTGLVVNGGVNLPRRTRRWLRAVEHRAAQQQVSVTSSDWRPTKRPTLSEAQLAGWRALVRMVEKQRAAPPKRPD